MTKKITREDIRRTIEAATREVESWPPWKQGILEHSAQPTSPRREPIIYEAEGCTQESDG